MLQLIHLYQWWVHTLWSMFPLCPFIQILPQNTETPECKEIADAQPDGETNPTTEEGTRYGHHHGHHHGHGHHGDHHGFHPRGFGHGRNHHHHGQGQESVSPQGHVQDDMQLPLDLGQLQQAVNMDQLPQEAHGALERPWLAAQARWKLKHSWQWAEGSDNEASPKASWCWHWRRLFGDVEGEQPVSLWHCSEALPASWQWHRLIGVEAKAVKETWQWRSPPAAWQEPQPAQWAWPQGASWRWEQL